MAGEGSPVTPAAPAAVRIHSTSSSAMRQVCRLAGRAIDLHRMLSESDHVVVGFSGGADSTALAIVLQALGYRVTLCHVDHAMRADSGLDVFHCRSTARRLGLRIEVVRVEVDPPSEAEARRVRYDALELVRRRLGADRIATGHTLNDDAETVRMRLSRGGFGLGIPPVRGLIVRPILSVPRRLTEGACREARILWLEDPSNTDMRFTRNRIRKELASGPSEDIARYAAIGTEARRRKTSLDARLAEFSRALVGGPEPRLDRASLLSAPPPVARGLIRLALESRRIDPSGRLVQEILTKVVPNPRSSMDLPGETAVWTEGGLKVSRQSPVSAGEGGWLIFGTRRREEDPVLPEAEIKVPGVTLRAEWGWRVAVSLEAVPPLASICASTCEHVQWLDAGLFKGRVVLRQWRPGDRFHPLRRTPPRQALANETNKSVRRGSGKKLQDFFVDAKVPRAERHTTPLLTCNDDIIWVVGHRIDDRYKITQLTRTAARIEFSPETGAIC